jgi:hypothetical protein
VHEFHTLNRFVLTLDGHGPEDALILLSECRGAITHVEIFNLHDFEVDPSRYQPEIIEMVSVVNSGNPVKIKKFVRRVMRRVEERGGPRAEETLARLRGVLDNMAGLMGYYKTAPLRACLGTDSTGQSCRTTAWAWWSRIPCPGAPCAIWNTPRPPAPGPARGCGGGAHRGLPYDPRRFAMVRRAARLTFSSPLFATWAQAPPDWSRRRYFQATPETANIYTLAASNLQAA